MDGVGDPPSPNGLDSVRSVETIAEIALQILKIIRCAHENGIVLGAFSWVSFFYFRAKENRFILNCFRVIFYFQLVEF
jgi:hypothetical protein